MRLVAGSRRRDVTRLTPAAEYKLPLLARAKNEPGLGYPRSHEGRPTGGAAVSEERLIDAHGRRISDLRVSVTDRCDLRCRYCMPADGIEWLPRGDILAFEEIERVVRLLVGMGIEDVRLTGGEPLARRGFPHLVEMLAAIEGVRDLSVTTNGTRLERQAADLVAAGIDRVNVSIDSMARDRFFEITRRDALERVLRGLEAIAAYPEVRPIKVNAVAMRGLTEDEVGRFCELARSTSYQVRFIEFMPLDGDRAWRPEAVLTGEELRARIEELHPLVELPREAHATARVFRFRDGGGEVGFINPVSEPFCADCNRIRLTADGKLRTCLFSVRETDLLGALRGGASDDELERIVREAVWRKELKHRVNEPGFVAPPRTMSAIGG
jgi:cyclic pyranopterin phosphate synthase